ncbi:MAG: Cytochrome b6-f complex iron-sulfur subunit [Chloroflexi bacterium]|nr:Cytochrome b6-f complex iron-sulfur subunit [Chloroflexota bacterium]
MSKKTSATHIDRRGFVKIVITFLGTIMGVVIGLPGISYFISPALKAEKKDDWIPAGELESYPLGTPTLFNFTQTKMNGWERSSQSYGVYVLREDEKKITAFSNVCTHLSCRVSWKEDEKAYLCPCHDAAFDIQGEVIHGPPPHPLDEYQTKIEDGTLYIHLQEG